MTSVKLAFYARLALVLHALILVLFLMHFGKTLIIPLFFALLISFALLPVSNQLERWGLHRSLASVLSILSFIVIIGSFIYILSHQVVSFTHNLPELQSKVSEMIQQISSWVFNTYHIDYQHQATYLKRSAGSLESTAFTSLGATFLGVGEVIILTIFFLIFTFFMLYHRRLFKRFIVALFPESELHKVEDVIISAKSMINRYIIGLLTEMFILIVLLLSTFAILGIKYALLISVMAALLNVIPYLGIYTAMVISMIITLADGTPSQALTVGIVFIVAHFVDANILLPRIVGGNVKLNPLITIVAILTGKLIWGIPGMFLFIPLAAIIRIISEKVEGLQPWAILMGEDKEEKIEEKDVP
ncbi:Predicted PurR-regulated permease PerM [Chitinophaga sp. CF118]|uniref:AI-2E family transporter n=1 Tax=Chitinophaga sp. CF118 TaxID=1884367 RepID=UPI0008E42741|nr:AI-2E family transporter [Chitinophaga sp. CF118]SFE00059.1 Predicted PurR-regulated permease PerM [Chitinophaga sp. CF118]